MSVPIAIMPVSDAFLQRAKDISAQLSLPVIAIQNIKEINEFIAVLLVDENGLALQECGKDAAGPVYVDFVGGALGHRLKYGGGKGQMIAKACGLGKLKSPYILDATAGLGRDGFVLASLGARVQMVERVPVISALLQDGLKRALESEITHDIAARINFHEGNAAIYISNMEDAPDVIYMDPMFPERTKTALVKKEMRIFKKIIGADGDADALLQAALTKAKNRVVVKRPRVAPYLMEKKPSFVMEGKAGRFDVYMKV